MKTKGQNRGHCQVCGRIQVVLPDGNLAKHGYTVPNGYFRGTCQGSGELPLQVSRVITDAIIVNLRQTGDQQQVKAERLRSGADLPEHAQKLTEWGSRVYVSVDRRSQEPKMIPWHAANDAERKLQLETDIGTHEAYARFVRHHANVMTELATKVHGQPLIDRDQEELDRIAVRTAKKAPIAGAYRTKQAQKDDLEKLNRSYSKLREVITGRYLNEPTRQHGDAGHGVYYAVPFDLHQWRAKTSALVLKVYPELKDTVAAIEGLAAEREVIKARPVIK